MLYACVMHVMFSVCIGTRGAVGAPVWEVWVFSHADVVCVLCESCGSSQYSILHDLQFVDTGQGCKRRPYGRGILQSRSHDCLIGSHECFLLFTPACCCDICFVICSGVCACTEML